MPMLVKDVMSKPAITISEEKTTREAGELMKKVRKGLLVVVRKDKPVGVVSDSDLIKRIVATSVKSEKIKIKDIMSKPLISVRSNEDVMVAVRKMKKSNIHRLPVIDDGKLVGVVSLTDIARTSPEMVNLLEYRLKMKEVPFEIKEEFTSGICESCGNYFDHLIRVNDKWLCESCRDEMES